MLSNTLIDIKILNDEPSQLLITQLCSGLLLYRYEPSLAIITSEDHTGWRFKYF